MQSILDRGHVITMAPDWADQSDAGPKPHIHLVVLGAHDQTDHELVDEVCECVKFLNGWSVHHARPNKTAREIFEELMDHFGVPK